MDQTRHNGSCPCYFQFATQVGHLHLFPRRSLYAVIETCRSNSASLFGSAQLNSGHQCDSFGPVWTQQSHLGAQQNDCACNLDPTSATILHWRQHCAHLLRMTRSDILFSRRCLEISKGAILLDLCKWLPQITNRCKFRSSVLNEVPYLFSALKKPHDLQQMSSPTALRRLYVDGFLSWRRDVNSLANLDQSKQIIGAKTP